MREYKFRAWDKKNKHWFAQDNDNLINYLCVSQRGLYDCVVVLVKYKYFGTWEPISCKQLTNEEIENLEIMQYTGFKDKNGREIYEGDIVIAAWHYTEPTEVELLYFYYDVQEYFSSDDCEVIGNIYQNPELLKQ